MAYAVTLFAVGLIYRSTFIAQGYNPTDDGWLQSMAMRILAGQMPYQDFYFPLPPLSIYEQAALMRLVGNSYGILAARWVFSVEVSLASVLAFVIIGRYFKPMLAFLVTLPTCFFSVILFYFSNYSYDGEVLALLSLALLVHSTARRRYLAVLGGLAGGLAFMAKPTFLGLLPVVVLAAVADGLAMRQSPNAETAAVGGTIAPSLGRYVVGFAIVPLAVFGYFAAAGAGYDFINRAYLIPRQTYPLPLTFVIWQDLPQWLFFWPNISGYIALLMMLIVLVRVERVPDFLRLGAVAGIALLLLVRAIPSAVNGLPNSRQDALLLVALATLLLLNFGAIASSILARGKLKDRLSPPNLPVMALGLQYMAQFNNAGARFSYYGAFLSVPVALLLLHALAVEAPSARLRGPFVVGVPPWAVVIIGLVIALAGIVDTHAVVFRDGPRSQLTSSFSTPLLGGIQSRPANTEAIDGIVQAVISRTKPGDPIFVMPDYPALYFLTGRRNPTPTGWYETGQLSPEQTSAAVTSLTKDPPRVVILQTYDAGDFTHTAPMLNYLAIPQLRPIYLFLVAHYQPVQQIGDVEIYVPTALPATGG